jgi:hypothetical protein
MACIGELREATSVPADVGRSAGRFGNDSVGLVQRLDENATPGLGWTVVVGVVSQGIESFKQLRSFEHEPHGGHYDRQRLVVIFGLPEEFAAEDVVSFGIANKEEIFGPVAVEMKRPGSAGMGLFGVHRDSFAME